MSRMSAAAPSRNHKRARVSLVSRRPLPSSPARLGRKTSVAPRCRLPEGPSFRVPRSNRDGSETGYSWEEPHHGRVGLHSCRACLSIFKSNGDPSDRHRERDKSRIGNSGGSRHSDRGGVAGSLMRVCAALVLLKCLFSKVLQRLSAGGRTPMSSRYRPGHPFLRGLRITQNGEDTYSARSFQTVWPRNRTAETPHDHAVELATGATAPGFAPTVSRHEMHTC